MTTATASVIPFGARAEREPYTIDLDGSTFHYDPVRQVNVMSDGSLLAHSTLRASCTNTNWDSKNDDSSDPYMIR